MDFKGKFDSAPPNLSYWPVYEPSTRSTKLGDISFLAQELSIKIIITIKTILEKIAKYAVLGIVGYVF